MEKRPRRSLGVWQRESLDKDNMNDEDKKIYDDLFARYKKVTFTKPTLAIKSKKAS